MILKLYEAAYTLAPFAPEATENYVKILFNKQCKCYSQTLVFSFGFVAVRIFVKVYCIGLNNK